MISHQIGDTGPAGGIVFYDKGDDTDGWRYLEGTQSLMRNGEQMIMKCTHKQELVQAKKIHKSLYIFLVTMKPVERRRFAIV